MLKSCNGVSRRLNVVVFLYRRVPLSSILFLRGNCFRLEFREKFVKRVLAGNVPKSMGFDNFIVPWVAISLQGF